MTAEYTPMTDVLRDLWVDHLLDPLPRAEGIALVPTVQTAFDRWLAEHDAEVRAKAVEDEADWIEQYNLGPLIEYSGTWASRLRARAAAIREGRA